jgi:hypothetical protein
LHPEKLVDFKAKRDGKKDCNYGIEQLALLTALATISFVRSHWILDTGATTHVTNDRADYIEFSERSDLSEVETGNGFIRPGGIGTVVLRVKKSDGSIGILTLYDIVYMPTFPVKIFSLLKLLMIGGTITKSSLIKPNGREIAIINIISGGAYLVLSNEPKVLSGITILPFLAVPAASTSSGAQTLELWHRRLGYTGIENTKLTSRMVKGMDINP